MDRAAWYRVPTTCNACRYTQLLMASCTAAEHSSDTVAAVSSICLSKKASRNRPLNDLIYEYLPIDWNLFRCLG
jgi:hypothetical protein